MRRWLPVWIAIASCVALAVGVFDLGREWRLIALVGALAAAWLLVVLSLPWDLHFRARTVLQELDRSLARELKPDVSRPELVSLVRRTLLVAVGLHVGSALAVAAAWAWTGQRTFLAFGAVFLATTALRPVSAWYGQVQERLRRSLGEVKVPRDDAIALKAQLAHLTQRTDQLERELAAQHDKAEERHKALLQDGQRLAQEAQRLDRRLDAIGRRFEETVEHLTDNKELLAGVRAFLRLVKSES